jgi:hypothetical protein
MVKDEVEISEEAAGRRLWRLTITTGLAITD